MVSTLFEVHKSNESAKPESLNSELSIDADHLRALTRAAHSSLSLLRRGFYYFLIGTLREIAALLIE